MTFTTPSLPGHTFAGRVFDVNTTPTSGTLSYRVRMLQPNPGLALRGGMLVEVTTRKARHEGELLVPSGAVVAGAKGASIFIVVNGKAKAMPVRVGLRTDTRVEVRGPGLTTATKVITAQPAGLQDGSAVIGPGIAAAPGPHPIEAAP